MGIRKGQHFPVFNRDISCLPCLLQESVKFNQWTAREVLKLNIKLLLGSFVSRLVTVPRVFDSFKLCSLAFPSHDWLRMEWGRSCLISEILHSGDQYSNISSVSFS